MQRRVRGSLGGTHIHRVLGERLFRDALWIHDKRAIAGGVSLGLFISLTPTIPLQMLLAASGAIYFRVNLPIALALCWVTNPVTAVPIYLYEWRLGRYILEEMALVGDFFDLYPFEHGMGRVLRNAAYVCTGSLVVASGAAIAANIAVRLLWRAVAHAPLPRRLTKHKDKQ